MKKLQKFFFKDQAQAIARAKGEALASESPVQSGEVSCAQEDENKQLGKIITDHTGINKLLPGAKLDAYQFEPCGYSMNGVLLSSYFTIHVTPESHCSYVSFATNTKMASYTALIRNVLQIFRPKRFVMTLFADELALSEIKEHPFATNKYDIPAYGCYNLKNKSQTQFEGDWTCEMGNFSLEQNPKMPTPKATARAHRTYSE